MVFCADLVRDRSSSLLLTEPARDRRLAGAADNGWKLAGTADNGVSRAGTMETE